jgi:hypothetical protein
LIVIRSAGGREQGRCWNQTRALIVESNGDVRVIALNHQRGAGVHLGRIFNQQGQGRRAA